MAKGYGLVKQAAADAEARRAQAGNFTHELRGKDIREAGGEVIVRFLEQGNEGPDAVNVYPRHEYKVPDSRAKSGFFTNHFTCLKETNPNADCPGCLEVNEPIWTSRGLIPIGTVVPGDTVMGIDGTIDTVVDTRKKIDSVVSLKTPSRRDGLMLTTDHHCFIVPKEMARERMRGLHDVPPTPWLQFHSVQAPRTTNIALSEIVVSQTSEIEVGDYWLYPVVRAEERISPAFRFLLDEGSAWLCGLWLGDGWIGKRGIGIAFHSDQKDLVARAVLELERLGQRPKVHDRTREVRQSIEIEAYSVELASAFLYLFGKGAYEKSVPFDSLYWPVSIQRALIEGYIAADGSKSKTRSPSAVSRSKSLVNGLYALSVQAGLPVTIGKYDHKQKDLWSITWLQTKNTPKGFFSGIEGQDFYWSPVSSIDEVDGEREVVDIEVDRTSSFVTAVGVTHNCRAGLEIKPQTVYNLIQRNRPVWRKGQDGKPLQDASGNKIPEGQMDDVVYWKCASTTGNMMSSKDNDYRGLMSRDFKLKWTGANYQPYDLVPADVDSGPQSMSDNDRALAAKKHNLDEIYKPPSFQDAAQICAKYGANSGANSTSQGIPNAVPGFANNPMLADVKLPPGGAFAAAQQSNQ